MFGRIWSAISSVATALEAIAVTLNEGNAKLRDGFRLDVVHEESETLTEPVSNGRRKALAGK